MAVTRLISAQWYRSKLFWLLCLFVVYSAFGWLGVPLIIKDQVTKALKQSAQWETTMGEVRFNPYALSLEIKQLQIHEGAQAEKVLGFERFYVDFEALRSLSGTISFAQVELADPFVKLAIDAQGVTNFQHTFATGAATPEAAQPEATEPIKLFFRHIDISRGQVALFDESQGEPFSLSLQPLGLTLKEFNTALNEGGDYALTISLGEGQQLDWSGRIGIAPFQSKGTLALRNILPKTFWHYVKAASPYWLNDARISVEGQYVTALNDGQLGLQVQNSQLRIKQIALATDRSASDFFHLAELKVGPIQFDLAQSSLALGDIVLDAPELSALRNTNGEIDLLTPFAAKAATVVASDEIGASSTAETTTSKPFNWNINSIQVNKGQLHWQDQSLRTPADMRLQDLQLQLGGLSQDLSQVTPYQVDFAINESKHTLKGQLVAQPFSVEGEVGIEQFPLNWVQSYVSEATKAIVNSGTTSFTGRYQLAMGQSLMEQVLSGAITGDLQVDNLALSDSMQAKTLLGFEQLTLAPINLQLQPMAVTIDTVTLHKPYADAKIAQDGQLNLPHLLRAPEEPELSTAPTDQIPADQEQVESVSTAEVEADAAVGSVEPVSAMTLSIGQLLIQEGRIDFADAAQKPPFNTYFEQVTGSIQGLSSDVDAKSTLALTGNIENYGRLAIKGTLNPFSKQPNSHLLIDVSNVDLSTASTYAARYLGYPIDKGKLNLDLKYQINERRIDAGNRIIIDQFDLGDAVDSPDSLGLPLPLAIGLLSDTKGKIDIDLPVKGNLNDPGFSLGGVIFTAFKNLLKKVITSPFAFLSSLVAGDEDISAVSFDAGVAELSAEQTRKMLLLVEALKSRPNLNLEVRGVADLSIDAEVLKRQQLAQTLLALGDDPLSSREQLLSQSLSSAEIEALKVSVQAVDSQEAEQAQNAYLAALDQALLNTIQLPEVALLSLAKARAASVLKTLVEQGGIEQQRLYVMEPQVISSKQAGTTVSSNFNVNVR